MAAVEIAGLRKEFQNTLVIPELSLRIPDGSFTVLVGPSGCGKSTLLRCIAGLESTTSGYIRIGERDVTHVHASERGIAMVFQSYALYPHMTVRENMSYSLKLSGAPRADIDRRVSEAADILRLSELLHRKPGELSGGQRQRVAIGRAIVRKPDVFLFDEPLSNLDAALRGQMRVELARLHSRLGATMIYVTHDQVEAMTMADQIVVMQGGAIQQVGTPLDLYRHPANRFVAGFLGMPPMNFLESRHFDGLPEGAVGIRPEHLRLSRTQGTWRGEVTHCEHLGGDTLAYVRVEGVCELTVRQPGDSDVRLGETVYLSPQPGEARHFAPAGQVTNANPTSFFQPTISR